MAALSVAATLLGTTVFGLVAPILAVIAALALIGTIVALVISHWDELKVSAKQTWTDIKEGWNESMKACKEEAIMIWNAITNFLSQCWKGICNVANQVKSDFSNIWNSIWCIL